MAAQAQVPAAYAGDRPDGRGETRPRTWRETRPFFKTSEFIAYFVILVGTLISGAMSDRFDAVETWGIAAALTIGYTISRGLAKSGTRDPADQR